MIVLCTAHDEGYRDMAAITMPTVKGYAAKQGYAFVYEPNIEPTLADACKISLFHQLYAGGRFTGDDYYCWVDTDALVMNSYFDLEAYLVAELVNHHVLYGSDFNGINSGIWMARFTSHADHFLRVAQQTSFAYGWADQNGIIATYLQPIFTPLVKFVPGKMFNAMPYELYGHEDWAHKNEINNYEPGDFILHLPGIEAQTRMELLRHYREQAV